jgi:arylsulfatase
MSDRRNVVLVTVDSLRADHCGFMGYERDTTPTLDQMAEEGESFENAIAPGPSTYDSMPAIFTGRQMIPHTAGDRFEGDMLDRRTKNIALNMHSETIAEWFDRQGYATAAFTTNPYTGKHTAFARGFDDYEDFMGDGEGALMQKAAHVPVLSELKHVVTLVQGDRASKQWTDYYEEIIQWTRTAEEPYFLWVFLLDTHTPYLAGDEFRTETNKLEMYYHNWKLWMAKKWRESSGDSLDHDTLVSLYDDTIRAVDSFLGRLIGDLGDTDPAVVVHADHGEAFGEHNVYGHQDTLYEENVHVPLVVYNGTTKGAEDKPTSLTEIPALLRGVTNGQSHETVIDGPEVAVSTNWNAERFGVRGRERKYIATVEQAAGRIVEENVYDLMDDADERVDRSSEYDEFVTACRLLLRRHLNHCE